MGHSSQSTVKSKATVSTAKIAQLVDNKRRNMKLKLSQAQRDQILLNTAKEEVAMKKNMLEAIGQSNKFFEESMTRMTNSLTLWVLELLLLCKWLPLHCQLHSILIQCIRHMQVRILHLCLVLLINLVVTSIWDLIKHLQKQTCLGNQLIIVSGFSPTVLHVKTTQIQNLMQAPTLDCESHCLLFI